MRRWTGDHIYNFSPAHLTSSNPFNGYYLFVQFCINGRCIAEDENVIPDYSRVSEIIVPKPSNLQIPANQDPATVPYTSDDSPVLDQSATPPRRTAVLDFDDDVPVQNKNDQGEHWPSNLPPTPNKRTSVLDSDNLEEPETVRQRSYQPQGDEEDLSGTPTSSPLPPKRTSVLDNDHLEQSTPIQTISDHSHPIDTDKYVSRVDEYDGPGHYRVQSDEHSGKDVAHLRRTSHATEEMDDNLPFFSEGKGLTTARNLPNSVTKGGEMDLFDKSKDHGMFATGI